MILLNTLYILYDPLSNFFVNSGKCVKILIQGSLGHENRKNSKNLIFFFF